MLHEPVTTPPLTLSELKEMLSRYAENDDVSKVIRQAMLKRLSGVSPVEH
jgi:hypothetical protein